MTMQTPTPTAPAEALGADLDRWIDARIDASPLLTRVLRPSPGMRTFWQAYGAAFLVLLLFAGHKPVEHFDPRDPAERAQAAYEAAHHGPSALHLPAAYVAPPEG